MKLLDYLMSLGLGEVNVEEDHKIKMMIVRTSRELTPEQKAQCEEHVMGLTIRYVVASR